MQEVEGTLLFFFFFGGSSRKFRLLTQKEGRGRLIIGTPPLFGFDCIIIIIIITLFKMLLLWFYFLFYRLD